MLSLAVSLMLATPAPTEHFALVVGNNRSQDPRKETLRYADDDAVASAALMRELGATTLLFVTLDDDSQRLHTNAEITGAATQNAVLEGYEQLQEAMRVAKTVGAEVQFSLFYSGHGGVTRGEGYVELEDAHLTRTELLESILARSPADANHVYVDACQSYFVAFARGQGSQRAPWQQAVVNPAVTERFANTGFVLSTSSERDSYEWERYGAGVFSHQLRSALWGAADLDDDAQITYAELGAFLTNANASVKNARYRPDFFIRPPGGERDSLSRVLVRWPSARDNITLPQESGHVYLETASGERVFDVHSERAVTVSLPAARPLFLRRVGSNTEQLIEASGPFSSETAPWRSSAVSNKGALHLAFESLFAEPFGERAVTRFLASFNTPQVILEEPESLPLNTYIRRIALVTGVVALGAGGALSGVAWNTQTNADGASQRDRIEANENLRTLNAASVSAYSLAIGATLTYIVTTLLDSDE